MKKEKILVFTTDKGGGGGERKTPHYCQRTIKSSFKLSIIAMLLVGIKAAAPTCNPGYYTDATAGCVICPAGKYNKTI